MDVGQTTQLTIESIAPNGKGVASVLIDNHRRPVFVELTVPGDTIIGRITKQHKRYYEAELVSLIKKSPHRIAPSCPHFGICGACDFLHVSYEQQLKSKEQLLRHYLDKAKITYGPLKVFGASEPTNYRIKLRLISDGKVAGFRAKASHDIVPIKHCDIVREELNNVWTYDHRRAGEDTFSFDAQSQKVVRKGISYYHIGELTFGFDAQGFVQSNVEMNKQLIELVRRLTPQGSVLELYSGNGNLSIPLSLDGRSIVAVEGNERSHKIAIKNAELNGATVDFVCSDVSEFMDKNEGKHYDALILDPPREGLGDLVSECTNYADTIIYVSCNAQQLVKELTVFSESGYRVEEVYLIDMFPQTKHFETVALLRKQ